MCYHEPWSKCANISTGPDAVPFVDWSDRLHREAAAKVAAALARIQQGNFSNAKGVGAGVYEYRIDFGPGYRIYFGKDGDMLVILLGGGSKNRQQNDISLAHDRWKDYTLRKNQLKKEE
jgi:putative addiction module killer protein